VLGRRPSERTMSRPTQDTLRDHFLGDMQLRGCAQDSVTPNRKALRRFCKHVDPDEGTPSFPCKKETMHPGRRQATRRMILSFSLLLLSACAPGTEGSWGEVDGLGQPRYNLSCVPAGGKLYVFGGTVEPGSGAAATALVEVYDPATGDAVSGGSDAERAHTCCGRVGRRKGLTYRRCARRD